MITTINALIVSSDPILVYDIHTFGKDLFSEFEVVNSAEDALEIHEIGRFDIIYISLNLPGMNGSELIKNIQNYDKKQQFIVLFDEDDDKQLVNILRYDVSSFILKPISLEKFIRVTNRAKLLMNDCITCESVRMLQGKVSNISHQNDLQSNLLIQQSKLAQTGEMISMIAHQWRQPLSVITSIIAAIQTRMDLDIYKKAKEPYDQLESDLKNAFERIEESADFLSKTVNDFRNFYRPETGICTFSVSELIDSVCRMALLDKNQLNIDLKIIQDDSITLSTFENELKQVLINIINNAKDAFIEKNIQNPKLRISLKQGGAFVYINIVDNAGGIPASISEQIFLPYFSTKSEKNGTGIGLHMAKTIIESHIAGTLTVTNNEAFGGADFCIKIPFSVQEKTA